MIKADTATFRIVVKHIGRSQSHPCKESCDGVVGLPRKELAPLQVQFRSGLLAATPKLVKA